MNSRLLLSFRSRASTSFNASFHSGVSLAGSFGRRTPGSWSERIVNALSDSERSILLKELIKYKGLADSERDLLHPVHKSKRHSIIPWKIVFLTNGLPFIAFGFLDNAIMIVAGEYIDLTFSSMFGLSTMAAAGLGNWLSDLCGIGTASYVERFATSLGFVIPPVTADQMNSRSVRWATALGRACGITLGCFLGLLPLLWFKCEDKGANKADSSR